MSAAMLIALATAVGRARAAEPNTEDACDCAIDSAQGEPATSRQRPDQARPLVRTPKKGAVVLSGKPGRCA